MIYLFQTCVNICEDTNNNEHDKMQEIVRELVFDIWITRKLTIKHLTFLGLADPFLFVSSAVTLLIWP